MIPAMRAVASGSPLGSCSARSNRTTSSVVRSTPEATASRAEVCLSETSTIRAAPRSSTWVSRFSGLTQSIVRRPSNAGGAGTYPCQPLRNVSVRSVGDRQVCLDRLWRRGFFLRPLVVLVVLFTAASGRDHDLLQRVAVTPGGESRVAGLEHAKQVRDSDRSCRCGRLGVSRLQLVHGRDRQLAGGEALEKVEVLLRERCLVLVAG